jgi:predicted chitinase
MTINTDTLPKGLYVPKRYAKQSNIKQIQLANVKRLVIALEEAGVTNDVCQAAVLGICSVESGFLPIEELYSGNDKQAYFTQQYCTRKGLPASQWIYYGKGIIQLTGLATYKDTTKWYKIIYKEDPGIIEDPFKVMKDDMMMKIVVSFLFMKLPKLRDIQSSPDIFTIIQQKVNSGTKDKHFSEKRQRYEFFKSLGSGSKPTTEGLASLPQVKEASMPPEYSPVTPKPSYKDSGNTEPQRTDSEISKEPAHKQEAFRENRDANFSEIGFTDPQGKYPLREYMNESDVNRLSRGVLRRTCIEFKDSIRNVGIDLPFGKEYEQPKCPISAQYPFNKVTETESGHVIELDDTPGNERTHYFHRSGTFTEIDANGTTVNQIIGDNYSIMERNGYVYVKGSCNLTVEGQINIKCNSDVNLEVNGDANCAFHNDVTVGVANDLNFNVGNNFNLSIGGDYNLETGTVDNNPKDTKEEDKVYGGFTYRSKGILGFESSAGIFFKSGKDITSSSSGVTSISSGDNLILSTGKSYYLTASSNVTLSSGSDIFLSASSTNISGDLPLEGFVTNNHDTGNRTGASNSAPKSPDNSPKIEELDISFNPVSTVKVGDEDESKNLVSENSNFKRKSFNRKYPEVLSSNQSILEQLQPPERSVRENSKFENEDNMSREFKEYDERKSAAFPDLKDKEKEPTPPPNPEAKPDEKVDEDKGMSDTHKSPEEVSKPTSNPEIHKTIRNSKDFPLSFKISKNFTLGSFVPLNAMPQDIQLPKGLTDTGPSHILYKREDLVDNLAYLAENVAEVLYEMLGPSRGKYSCQSQTGVWCVNDGLRTKASENGKITGSDHFKGRAMDMRLDPKKSRSQMYNLVLDIKKALPTWKHLILEYRGSDQNWIHISYGTETVMSTGQSDGSSNEKRTYTYVNDKKVSEKFVLY